MNKNIFVTALLLSSTYCMNAYSSDPFEDDNNEQSKKTLNALQNNSKINPKIESSKESIKIDFFTEWDKKGSSVLTKENLFKHKESIIENFEFFIKSSEILSDYLKKKNNRKIFWEETYETLFKEKTRYIAESILSWKENQPEESQKFCLFFNIGFKKNQKIETLEKTIKSSLSEINHIADSFFEHFAKKHKIDMTYPHDLYRKKKSKAEPLWKTRTFRVVHYLQELIGCCSENKEIEKVLSKELINETTNHMFNLMFCIYDSFQSYKKESSKQECHQTIFNKMFFDDAWPSFDRMKPILHKVFNESWIDYKEKVISVVKQQRHSDLKDWVNLCFKNGHSFRDHPFKKTVLDQCIRFYSHIFKVYLSDNQVKALKAFYTHVDSLTFILENDLALEFDKIVQQKIIETSKNIIEKSILFRSQFLEKHSIHFDSPPLNIWETLLAEKTLIAFNLFKKDFKEFHDKNINEFFSYTDEPLHYMVNQIKKTNTIQATLFPIVNCYRDLIAKFDTDQSVGKMIIKLLDKASVLGDPDAIEQYLIMLAQMNGLPSFARILSIASVLTAEKLFNDPRDLCHYNEIALLVPLYLVRKCYSKTGYTLFMLYLQKHLKKFQENQLKCAYVTEECLPQKKHILLEKFREDVLESMEKDLFFFNGLDGTLKDLPGVYEEVMIALSQGLSETQIKDLKIIDLIKKVPIKMSLEEMLGFRDTIIIKEKQDFLSLETASFLFAKQRTIEIKDPNQNYRFDQHSILIIQGIGCAINDFSKLFSIFVNVPPISQKNHLNKENLTHSESLYLTSIMSRDFWSKKYAFKIFSTEDHFDFLISFFSYHFCFFNQYENEDKKTIFSSGFETTIGVFLKRLYENFFPPEQEVKLLPGLDILIIGKLLDEVNDSMEHLERCIAGRQQNFDPIKDGQKKLSVFLVHLSKLFTLYNAFTKMTEIIYEDNPTITAKKSFFQEITKENYIEEVKYFQTKTLIDLIHLMAFAEKEKNIIIEQECDGLLQNFLKEKNEKNFSFLVKKTTDTLEKLCESYKKIRHEEKKDELLEKKSICDHILYHFGSCAQVYGRFIAPFDKEGFFLKNLIDLFSFGTQFGSRECLKIYIGLLIEDRVVDHTPLNLIINLLQVLRVTKDLEEKKSKNMSQDSMEFNLILDRLLKILKLDPEKSRLHLEAEIENELDFLEKCTKRIFNNTMSIEDNMDKIDDIEKALKEKLSLSVIDWAELSKYKKSMEEKKQKMKLTPEERIFFMYANLLSFVYKKMDFSLSEMKPLRKEAIEELGRLTISTSENVNIERDEECKDLLQFFLNDKKQETFSALVNKLMQVEKTLRASYKNLIRHKNEEKSTEKKKIYSYILHHLLPYVHEYEKSIKPFDQDSSFLTKIMDIFSIGIQLGSRDCLQVYMDCLIDGQIIQQTKDAFIFTLLKVLAGTNKESKFLVFDFIMKRVSRMMDIDSDKRLKHLNSEINGQLSFIEQQTMDILKGVIPLKDYMNLINQKDKFLRDELLEDANSWKGLRDYKLTLDKKQEEKSITEKERIHLIYTKLVLLTYEEKDINDSASAYIFLNGYESFLSHYQELAMYHKIKTQEAEEQKQKEKEFNEKNIKQMELFNGKDKKINSLEEQIKELNKKLSQQSQRYQEKSKNQMSLHQEEIQGLKNKLEKKDEKIESLEKQLSNAKQKLSQQEKIQKEAVLKERQKKDQEGQFLQESLKKKEKKIKELLNQVNQQSIEIKKISEDRDNFSNINQRLKLEIKKTSEERDNFLNINQRLKEDKEKIEKLYQEVSEDLNQEQKKNKELLEDMEGDEFDREDINFFTTSIKNEKEEENKEFLGIWRNKIKTDLIKLIFRNNEFSLCTFSKPKGGIQSSVQNNQENSLHDLESILKNKEEIVYLINKYNNLCTRPLPRLEQNSFHFKKSSMPFHAISIFTTSDRAKSCEKILLKLSDNKDIKKWIYEIVSEEYARYVLLQTNQSNNKMVFFEKEDFDSGVEFLVKKMQKEGWSYEQIKDFMEKIQQKLCDKSQRRLKKEEDPFEQFQLICAEDLRMYACSVISRINQDEKHF